jgi:hypothetical protein
MKISIFFDWIKLLMNLFGIYILWIFIFYSASQMHVYFCTPEGIYGFLMTPFLSQTPHCTAIRWMISNGSLHINAFWTLIASIAVKKLAII